MTEQTPTWDEVRRIADELELKIHLAGMDARDRWRDLKPRLAEIENRSRARASGQATCSNVSWHRSVPRYAASATTW